MSLKVNFLCENIAFVHNNKYKYHNFAQLLIGHNYAHLKSGAFSLDMSRPIYQFSLPQFGDCRTSKDTNNFMEEHHNRKTSPTKSPP